MGESKVTRTGMRSSGWRDAFERLAGRYPANMLSHLIQAPLWSSAWGPPPRFTVIIPTDEVLPNKKAKLTLDDEDTLLDMFCHDFGGFSRLPKSPGYGLRKPEADTSEQRPMPELNYNIGYVLYTSPVSEAARYFRALQIELREALNEGRILIEQQEVILL